MVNAISQLCLKTAAANNERVLTVQRKATVYFDTAVAAVRLTVAEASILQKNCAQELVVADAADGASEDCNFVEMTVLATT